MLDLIKKVHRADNGFKEKIISARSKMLKHIDTTMTEVYWYVGKITY